MSRFAPTTKAQVSGHKFLVRRMQHALVLGDIRMIHDPLAARRRALIFGTIAVVLIAAGSGLLAWLRPDPNPGEAMLMRSEQSQLYVRVDDSLHPVANLVSARLILGEAAEPVSIGESALENMALGTPVGIPDAPIALAAPQDFDPLAPAQPNTWAACIMPEDAPEAEFPTPPGLDEEAPNQLIVSTGHDLMPVAEPTAAYLTHEGQDWLITPRGRVGLPSATSDEGRIVRRILKLDNPREVSAEFLNTFTENPPIRLPQTTLLYAGNDAWAEVDGGVYALTKTQAAMLEAASRPARAVREAELAALADAPSTDLDALPTTIPSLMDDTAWLCANTEGHAVAVAPIDSLVELSGDGAASHFAGLPGGAVAADTGYGVHVINETGRRHEVEDAAAVNSLGIAVEEAAWPIIRLLPEATPLSRDRALEASY